jgi:hypothetical protein
VGAPLAPDSREKKAGGGLVSGDVDNDGDLDLLVSNNGQAADLLRNDGGNRQHALVVRAIGSAGNRDAIGARLRLTAGSRTQIREIKAGSSYLGQNDLRLHFGLGEATRADRLDVRWPSGRVETVRDVEANQIVTVREGNGIIRRVPFTGR